MKRNSRKLKTSGWVLSVLFVCLALVLTGCGNKQKTTQIGPNAAMGPPPMTFGDKFYDVAASDKDHVWAVGYFGAITHSSDGGKTFTRQQAGTMNALTGVFFINSKEGWIVGDLGTILHTNDGGLKWEPQKSPVTDQKLLKVQFLSEKEGFAIGTFGVVLATKDGGITWNRLPFKDDITLNDLFFFNPREGYIAGEFETILHTMDGGATFQKQHGDQLGQLFGIAFKDKKGIAVGTAGKVLITSDGGSWKEVKSVTDDTLLKVKFIDSKAIAIGLRGAVITSDNGQDWSPEVIPGHYSWLSGVAFIENVGYLVGGEGKILATNDSGKTWTRLGFAPPVGHKE